MYLVPIEARPSKIDGKGVFALRRIIKGEIVWKYEPRHDRTISALDFNKMDKEARVKLKRVAYLSSESNNYIYPPENDPALYTNHSEHNNLTAIVDKKVSPEPFFVANKDIQEGEEITNNYFEFDKALDKSRPKEI